jgi:PAS domain S-box-containing protein
MVTGTSKKGQIRRAAADGGNDRLQSAKEKARKRGGRNHELIEALSVAIYSCDAAGYVTFYNEAASDLWGREPEVGKDQWCGSWRIYDSAGADLPFDECPMATAVKEGRPVRGEIVIEKPDGSRLDILAHASPLTDESGAVTGAINLLMDISAQKRSERAAAERAAIVRSSEDAIVSKDLDGTVRSWNHGAERIFGYRADEIVGKPITTIIPEHLRDQEHDILKHLCRGEPIEHFETKRVTKDGRVLDVSVTISPIHDTTGRVIGASKIARDISEMKRATRALREADRRKDEFLAMLAHELRNPLSAVSNAVELLGLPGGEAHLEACRRIIGRQTAHLVRIVEDLLDISRITRGVVTLRSDTLNAVSVIDRAVESVSPLVTSRRHELKISVPAEPLWLKGDSTRLEQLVSNLLTNSARYTHPGGHIEIEALRRDDTVVIHVRDDGIGISSDLLPDVFDLFSQSERAADRETGGLGIGLTLVKAIAEMHGGSVEAKSEGLDRGSEFTVRLPALLEAPAEDDAGRRRRAEDAGPMARRRILIVDDNRDSTLLLSRLLEASGHTVEQAFDGPAALKAAAAFRPDAILLDIGLPKLDGHEVARRLRRQPEMEDVLLIAISGYCQNEDRERSLQAGFDHHLAKPLDRQTLLELLAGNGG